LKLSESCPFHHANPEDCPCSAQGNRAGEACAWINALSESDLEYLAAYHRVCLSISWIRSAAISGLGGLLLHEQRERAGVAVQETFLPTARSPVAEEPAPAAQPSAAPFARRGSGGGTALTPPVALHSNRRKSRLPSWWLGPRQHLHILRRRRAIGLKLHVWQARQRPTAMLPERGVGAQEVANQKSPAVESSRYRYNQPMNRLPRAVFCCSRHSWLNVSAALGSRAVANRCMMFCSTFVSVTSRNGRASLGSHGRTPHLPPTESPTPLLRTLRRSDKPASTAHCHRRWPVRRHRQRRVGSFHVLEPVSLSRWNGSMKASQPLLCSGSMRFPAAVAGPFASSTCSCVKWNAFSSAPATQTAPASDRVLLQLMLADDQALTRIASQQRHRACTRRISRICFARGKNRGDITPAQSTAARQLVAQTLRPF